MVATRLTGRGAILLASLVLARLLTPDDFGLVAMALLAMSLLESLTAMGLKDAVVQAREAKDELHDLLDTSWTLQALRGFIIFVLLLAVAPIVANFFEEPRATPILRALALVPLLRGVESAGLIEVQRQLDFRRLFLHESSRAVVYAAVGIALAWKIRNVWALVVAQIVATAVALVVSYISAWRKPRFVIRRRSLRSLWSFGKWVFVGTLFGYIQIEGDSYFVGSVFGAQALGLYVIAYKLSNVPIVEIGKAVGKALLPTYAKIYQSPERLRNAFLKVYETILGLILPLAIGISLVASDFTSVILGDQWLNAIPLIQILSIAAAVRGLSVAGSGFWWGIGKPRTAAYLSAIHVVVLGLGFLTFPSRFGLPGVAIAVGVAYAVSFGIFLWKSIVQGYLSLRDWYGALWPTGLQLGVMIIAVLLLSSVMDPGLGRLIAVVVIGAVGYLAAGVVLMLGCKRGMIMLLRNLWRQQKRIVQP